MTGFYTKYVGGRDAGGDGSGAFGAIIAQGAGSRERREAAPVRTSPVPRPSAATDTWPRSLGSIPAQAASITLTEASVDRHDAVVITFPAGAASNGIRVTPGGVLTDYNPATRVFAISSNLNTQGVVDAINSQRNFPGTAALAPGEPGDRFLLSASYVAAGGSDYYSQVLVVNNLLQGDASNLSVVVEDANTTNPASSVDWNENDRVLTIYLAGVPLSSAGLVTLAANIRAANNEFTLTNFGLVGGSSSNGDDTPPLGDVRGFIIAAGQRIDWSGGADAGDFPADVGQGLFVYTDETTPEWELRGVERQIAEAPVAAGFTILGAGSGNSLRLTYSDPLEADLDVARDGRTYSPEQIQSDFGLAWSQYPDYRAAAASLEYNDAVRFLAATPGAAGNNLRVNMQQGTPAVEAVTALGAVASLADGGTRLVDVDWPESLGADANGRQVQVGAPRNIAGVQATAAIYGETFNDRIGTATWYLPGSAINGIRVGIIGTGLSTQADNTAVGSAAGTLGNILFINVRVAGTVSYQDIIDAFNAIRVSGTQILTAALDNGVDGTTTFDPAQNLGADFAGGVDGTADEVSGAAYWSRAVGLLYLASDGTVTAAQAVTAINAARTGATASVDTEATNNNIRFTAVQAGALGNGIQIVISRGAGYSVSVAARVITVTYPNVASSSGTLIDTINGNTDAAALITASAIDSTVNFNSNRYVGTFTTAGGVDGFDGMAALVAQGVSGTVVPNQTVTAAGGVTAVAAQARSPLSLGEFVQNNVRSLIIRGVLPNVDTVQDFIDTYTDTTKAFDIEAVGAATDFVVTTPRNAGDTLLNAALAGGRDATTRQDASVTESNRVWTVRYHGTNVPANLRTTLAQLETAFKAINGGAAGTAASLSIPVDGGGTIDVTFPAGAASNGIVVNVVSTGNASPIFAASGRFVTVYRVRSGQVTRNNTANEIVAALNGLTGFTAALAGGASGSAAVTAGRQTAAGGTDGGPVPAAFIQDTETGDQSAAVATPLPTRFSGGRNRIPESPVEFLLRGEDEADGRNVEVRYHSSDTLQDLLDAANDSARNPDGVTVLEIAGTELGGAVPELPFTIPMVPGSGGGFELADEIHEFTWTNDQTAVTDTDAAYLAHDYLIFEGWLGGAATDRHAFTTAIKRADIPASGNSMQIISGVGGNAGQLNVTLTTAGLLTLDPRNANADSGKVAVWGSNSPSGVARGQQGRPGRPGTGGGGGTTYTAGSGITISGSSIAVTNPFTDADETKLDGLPTITSIGDRLTLSNGVLSADAQSGGGSVAIAVPEWAQLTAYPANQLVEHNGGIYRALAAIDNQQRSGPDGDTTRWQFVTSYRGVWAVGFYHAGQIVLRNGTFYIARENITSSDTTAPESDATHWASLGGAAFTPTQANIYDAVKAIIVNAANTNTAAADDTVSEIDIRGALLDGGGRAVSAAGDLIRVADNKRYVRATGGSSGVVLDLWSGASSGDSVAVAKIDAGAGAVAVRDDSGNTLVTLQGQGSVAVFLDVVTIGWSVAAHYESSAGGGTTVNTADLIHTFTWSGDAGAQTDTDEKYNDYSYLVFVGRAGQNQNARDFFNVAVERAQIPASGAGGRIYTDDSNYIAVTLTSADVLSLDPSGNQVDTGRVQVFGTNSPILAGGGGGTTPTEPVDFRFGTKAGSAAVVAADFTLTSADGTIDLTAYQGDRRLLIARLASEPDITSVLFSDDSSQTNQVGVFTKQTGTITIDGSAYNWWRSNQSVSQPTDVTITVR